MDLRMGKEEGVKGIKNPDLWMRFLEIFRKASCKIHLGKGSF